MCAVTRSVGPKHCFFYVTVFDLPAHHWYHKLAKCYDYRLTDLFEYSLNSLLTDYYTESPQIGSEDPLMLTYSSLVIYQCSGLMYCTWSPSYWWERFYSALGSCTIHRALLIDGNTSTMFQTPVLYTVLYIDATQLTDVYKVASLCKSSPRLDLVPNRSLSTSSHLWSLCLSLRQRAWHRGSPLHLSELPLSS